MQRRHQSQLKRKLLLLPLKLGHPHQHRQLHSQAARAGAHLVPGTTSKQPSPPLPLLAHPRSEAHTRRLTLILPPHPTTPLLSLSLSAKSKPGPHAASTNGRRKLSHPLQAVP